MYRFFKLYVVDAHNGCNYVNEMINIEVMKKFD